MAKRDVEGALSLQFSGLSPVPSGFRFRVGDFQFSAYLKSLAFEELHRDGLLDLDGMTYSLMDTIEDAKVKIGKLFRTRGGERARVVVERWKEQNIYPYEGEPKTHLEEAERNLFDIVAVTVQEASPELGNAPPKQTELHLRFLRGAIQNSPDDLQRILDEVLKLSKRQRKELATLLDETALSGMISASRLVADRLKFIDALGFILFDCESRKKIKERAQLHKILERNT